MPGTIDGGKRAAATNMERYGSDFYTRIGAKGGVNGSTGGFAAGEAGRARARKYGAIGGAKSKRGPGKKHAAMQTRPVQENRPHQVTEVVNQRDTNRYQGYLASYRTLLNKVLRRKPQ